VTATAAPIGVAKVTLQLLLKQVGMHVTFHLASNHYRYSNTTSRYTTGHVVVVNCSQACYHELIGSNLTCDYCVLRTTMQTQCAVLLGSVNKYQRKLVKKTDMSCNALAVYQ